MHLEIVGIISDNLEHLTNKQKIIAQYLINNSDKIGFMSLKEISEEINVSEVTILNFCKNIGIDSFTELKKLFQELITRQFDVPIKVKSSLKEIKNSYDAYNNTIKLQRFNHERIIKDNSIGDLEEISQVISKTKKVYICGQGMSEVIAEYLNSRLKLINIDSRIVKVGDIISASLDFSRATEEDCFILISFPKYSHNVIGLSRYLIENNYTFISITDSDESPIAKGSKYILRCNSSSLVFLNFISATTCLIEILLVMISFNMRDNLMMYLEKLEQIRSSLKKQVKNN